MTRKLRVIGIAGTAKNTGKTTTTISLLRILNNKGIKAGLTSIGYDGESIDNITGLTKPKIVVNRGMLVAISLQCQNLGTAGIEVLESLNISTSLGKIICGTIIKEGSS